MPMPARKQRRTDSVASSERGDPDSAYPALWPREPLRLASEQFEPGRKPPAAPACQPAQPVLPQPYSCALFLRVGAPHVSSEVDSQSATLYYTTSDPPHHASAFRVQTTHADCRYLRPMSSLPAPSGAESPTAHHPYHHGAPPVPRTKRVKIDM
ncbi:hypothetical protein MN608_11168 [Microdochium nivale]|nr:hypothetical protein MN608_11168 [Microdochium nivale]